MKCWQKCWHFAKLHRLNAARTLFFTDLLRLCKIRSQFSHCWIHVMLTKFIVQLALKAFEELRMMPASFEFQYVPTNLERGPHPTSAGRRQMQLPWLSSGYWKSFFKIHSVDPSEYEMIRMENRTWKNSIFTCAEHGLVIHSDWCPLTEWHPKFTPSVPFSWARLPCTLPDIVLDETPLQALLLSWSASKFHDLWNLKMLF